MERKPTTQCKNRAINMIAYTGYVFREQEKTKDPGRYTNLDAIPKFRVTDITKKQLTRRQHRICNECHRQLLYSKFHRKDGSFFYVALNNAYWRLKIRHICANKVHKIPHYANKEPINVNMNHHTVSDVQNKLLQNALQ